ncbi:hypothetical protein T484DRAFT_1981771 [Baffinella frigidus]|nr:hypothetical protein T484DRAFT_1981771 [Cryptophyta sp. CCMP2293]
MKVSSLSLVCRTLAGAASPLPSGVTSGSEGRSGALFPGTINGVLPRRACPQPSAHSEAGPSGGGPIHPEAGPSLILRRAQSS